LLLSELGAYLSSPHHAPAGTKRLSRLLHAPGWSSHLIEHFRLPASGSGVEQVGTSGREGIADVGR
jgi:hypothetical protein